MADPLPTAYQFLPWVRRGVGAALSQTETLGDLNAHASVGLGAQLAGLPATTITSGVELQLYGPGDVIGIDTSLVVRTDPKPGTTNFEPNYLAVIDFDPPEFPWALTPASANLDQRLRPWLVLVVLDKSKVGAPRVVGTAPLPQIRIAAAHVQTELPSLGDSWSWAHAQVVSEAKANDVAAIGAELQQDPRSNISRLVCPRRLNPDTDYVACVVPAFEPGRLRGLGLVRTEAATEMQTLAPAWRHPAVADVVLPVYHHWEFSTGADGDFEALARKLRTPKKWKDDPVVKPLLEKMGTAPMSVDALIDDDSPATDKMEGALVPIGYNTPAIDDTHQKELRKVINTLAEQVQKGHDDGTKAIEVKPPIYGAWHAGQHSVELTDVAGWWLAGLNLAPRYRGAAGHGAEVVRKNQEDYVDASWDQAGAIPEADMKLNLTRLAIEAQRLLKAKHFDVLPPERLLQVMGSALPRIEALDARGNAAFAVRGVTASIGGQIDRSSLPASLVDSALRRVASPQQRRLRTAAMRMRSLAKLPTLASQYVEAMAAATKKSDGFAVNRFMPDGIAGTKLLDGVAIDGELVDLSRHGLRKPVAATQIKRTIAAADKARVIANGRGVPLPSVSDNSAKGVFTDVHVQRLGALLAASPTFTVADFDLAFAQMNLPGRAGSQGFLLEAQIDGSQLQLSALRYDARAGALRLDKPLLRMTGDRKLIKPSRAEIASASGLALGGLSADDARLVGGSPGVFANLPPNALDLQGGNSDARFTFDAGLGLDRVGAAPPRRDVASITLPPPLRDRGTLKRFAIATRGMQTLWRDAFKSARVAALVVDFPIAASAAIVRARTHPELTLAARLASQVSIADAALGQTSPHVAQHLLAGAGAALQRFAIPALFDRVMAYPHLREPMYRALVRHDQDAFMPGIGELPPDLVMLMQVNQPFIDSFMVGANFEMNRELLWRGFPTDLRGTPFQRFWDRVEVRRDGTRDRLDDILPIHTWGKTPLGRRGDPNNTSTAKVALIIKGRLLLRYPNTAVYAWKQASGKLLKKEGSAPDPDNDIKRPIFAGFIEPDVTFFGFDIDRDDIEKWCFVVEEQMTEPRFGFDTEGDEGRVGAKPRLSLVSAREQLESGTPTPAFKRLTDRGFNAWKALSWSDVDVAAGKHISISELVARSQPANAPFASFPELSAKPNAAEVAQALLQLPFRGYWPGGNLVMPSTTP